MNLPLLALMAAPLHPIWQIGRVDGSPAEFGLAPGRYAQYREDPLYVVGHSPARDLPYVLPGPDDQWAGSRIHRADFVFGLAKTPADGTFRLEVALADTHPASPPELTVSINGRPLAAWKSPGGSGDDLILGKATEGRRAAWQVEIPARWLSAGNNTLSLQNARGSWVVFDAVSLSGPSDSDLQPVAPALDVSVHSARQAVLRTPQGARQPIDLDVLNIGPATKGTLRVDGQRVTVALRPGRQSIEALVRPVSRSRPLPVRLTAGTVTVSRSGTVTPVRPWTVYVLPHSHVDIGYTDPQDYILKMHQRNFLDALDLAQEYAANPKDSKFHFNVEATWVLDRLLASGREVDKARIIEGLRNQTLFMSAGYANLLTGVMHPEEMMQSFRYSRLIGKKYGLTLDTVTQTDVPGMTWGNVVALYASGIRNVHLMPNVGDRVGGVHRAWRDRPFWWVSPSGRERIFVWQTDEYSVGHGLGWTGDRSKPLRSANPTARFIGSTIFPKLERLARANYPYDIVAEPWSPQDNAPVDADVPAAARRWNAQYVYPRVVVSTVKNACEVMKRKYGNQLPVIRGDYTPYWEDGVGSTASETAMNRATPDRLLQAETLFASAPTVRYPADQFLEAWRNVILFSEHTWGAWNSISSPDDPGVTAQWAVKSSFATTADAMSRDLMRSVFDNPTQDMEVRNTSSWSRTDLVRLTPEQSRAGDRVVDAGGAPLPSQRLRSGELAVLVNDVPPLGAKRIRVVTGPAFVRGMVTVNGNTVRSNEYQLKLDPKTASVTSLLDRRRGRELAAGPLNQYRYLLGTDLKNLQSTSATSLETLESGPLLATVRMTSTAPGTRVLLQEITVVAGLDRVEFSNHLDKLKVAEKEAVHFAFPFAVEKGAVRVELPWSVIQPEKDQIPGANKNWLTTYGYTDVSNQDFGVTWSSLDAPLIEVGEISANVLGSAYDASEWRAHIAPTQTVYSWALNNHWHTNYKATQEGPLNFRYAVQAHGPYAGDTAYRFGAELRAPLLVGPALGSTESLFTVSDPTVVATRVVPTDDGRAILVRLYGTTQVEKVVTLRLRRDLGTVSLSDAMQRPLRRLGERFAVPGWGVVTLRIERK